MYTLHTDQRSKRIYQTSQYWITQLISGDDKVEMNYIYPWKQQVLRLEIVFDFWLELHALCPASRAPDSPTETMQQCNNADWWLPGNHKINIYWHSGFFITQQASSHVYFQSDCYFSKYLFFSISLLNESLSELIHPSDWDKNISNWLKKYRRLFSLLYTLPLLTHLYSSGQSLNNSNWGSQQSKVETFFIITPGFREILLVIFGNNFSPLLFSEYIIFHFEN